MTKEDFINEAFGTRLKGEKFHQELVIFEEANKNQLLGKNQGEDANHLKKCFDIGYFDKNGKITPTWDKNSINPLIRNWVNAKNIEEFYENIKSDKETRNTQFVGVLFKNDWKLKRSMIGDKQFKTHSDMGGLKIGNDKFSIVISSGGGDGTTRVAIFDKQNEFNSSLFDFKTSVEGEIDIFDYDCGGEVVKTINGRYGIYASDGFIIFEKWE